MYPNATHVFAAYKIYVQVDIWGSRFILPHSNVIFNIYIADEVLIYLYIYNYMYIYIYNLYGLSCQEKVSRFSMLPIPRNGTSLAVSRWKLRMVLVVN